MFFVKSCCQCTGLLATAVVVCVLVDYIPATCVLCELPSELFVQVRVLLLTRQTLVGRAVAGEVIVFCKIVLPSRSLFACRLLSSDLRLVSIAVCVSCAGTFAFACVVINASFTQKTTSSFLRCELEHCFQISASLSPVMTIVAHELTHKMTASYLNVGERQGMLLGWIWHGPRNQKLVHRTFVIGQTLSPSRISDNKNMSLKPERTRVHQHLNSTTAG